MKTSTCLTEHDTSQVVATEQVLCADSSDERSVYTWLSRFVKGAHSVLEIGCSAGYFGRHLVAPDCRVIGVELDAAAAEQAKSAYQGVIVGDIEDPRIQAQVGGCFDAVVLGDVLEHLRMPGALLECIRELWLGPDGWVVLSVPNSGHWIFRREILLGRFPYRQQGLFDRTHLRFFTWESLRALVDDAGYQIERKAGTVNSNMGNDITFRVLKPLYYRADVRHWMTMLESHLARWLPRLFAYQFVLKIRPKSR
jgi:2-polyprenyl-3-methyl-5-hydroxy-6-metoxy-1,4-benzoquinol methylase